MSHSASYLPASLATSQQPESESIHRKFCTKYSSIQFFIHTHVFARMQPVCQSVSQPARTAARTAARKTARKTKTARETEIWKRERNPKEPVPYGQEESATRNRNRNP